MELKNLLTIVVPLKGRPEYTKRILEYSNYIECPFKILLGDGGDDNISLNPNNFPNINFEYIKYPYDKDIKTYNKKMNDLLSRIETPLTMLIDNDNFFCLNGVINIINFLNKNKDFVGGRGSITRCVVKGKYLGSENRKMHYHKSVLGNSASKRIINNINLFHTHLHDIVRTNAIQTAHHILDVLDSNDFKIFIRLNAFCTTIYGNNYRNDDFAFVFHEDRTPRIKGQVLPLDCKWILEPYWENSMAKLVSAVGVSISYIDKINLYSAKKIFLDAFINKLLVRKDPNHKITENKDRNYLINISEKIIKKSDELGIDKKIMGCLLLKRTNGNFDIEEIKAKNISDMEFRNILNRYLSQRKFCI